MERGSPGAVAGGEGVYKVKRALEEVTGVKEWDGVGPSNVLGGRRVGSWFEFNSFQILNDVVRRCAVSVPDWPPASVLFRQGGISRGGSQEVAAVGTGGGWVGWEMG